MVLLAGDLFHDNKPSRRTLHKTMDIFKKYTMGPSPVQIQILSENNFANGDANYLQEFCSVGECGKRMAIVSP
jgi:double-strand break repair protein MRE11